VTIEEILVLKLAVQEGFSGGMSISLVLAGLSEINCLMTANS